MRIPAILAEAQAEAEPAGGLHEAAAGRQLVLVIDDDPSQGDLLTRFLERQGFAVQTAPDGGRGWNSRSA